MSGDSIPLRTSAGDPNDRRRARESAGDPSDPAGNSRLNNSLAGREQMARLWAGWRIPYILADDDERTKGHDDGLTLFEGIEQSGLDDSVTYVLWRGEHCFALLNAYPYTSGHLMVLPKKAAVNVEDLDDATFQELWEGVRMGITAVKAEYQPQGVNMGMNLGRASGAGVPDHMHVHVLPRWSGDTNFLTSIAEARALPESLSDSWERLTRAWPTS